ncbi:MAG: hypothetical protein LBJ24_06565 [Treponema sp.]|nr:hypothetical protein [Treponema sp.]
MIMPIVEIVERTDNKCIFIHTDEDGNCSKWTFKIDDTSGPKPELLMYKWKNGTVEDAFSIAGFAGFTEGADPQHAEHYKEK